VAGYRSPNSTLRWGGRGWFDVSSGTFADGKQRLPAAQLLEPLTHPKTGDNRAAMPRRSPPVLYSLRCLPWAARSARKTRAPGVLSQTRILNYLARRGRDSSLNAEEHHPATCTLPGPAGLSTRVPSIFHLLGRDAGRRPRRQDAWTSV